MLLLLLLLLSLLLQTGLCLEQGGVYPDGHKAAAGGQGQETLPPSSHHRHRTICREGHPVGGGDDGKRQGVGDGEGDGGGGDLFAQPQHSGGPLLCSIAFLLEVVGKKVDAQ